MKNLLTLEQISLVFYSLTEKICVFWYVKPTNHADIAEVFCLHRMKNDLVLMFFIIDKR